MKFAKDFDFVQAQLANPPSWSGEKLLAWRDVFTRSVEPFITKCYWTDTGSLNVFRIVGTDHPDYIGKTWLEFLQTGKRMSPNLDLLEKNPDYYQSLCLRQPRMLFTSLDGLDFYVSSDGNHRSCIARFFLHGKGQSQLHNLSITQYQVDWVFLRVYQELLEFFKAHSLRINAEVINKAISREDSSGWKLDTFQVALKIEDFRAAGIPALELGFHEALKYLEDWKKFKAQENFRISQNNLPLFQRIKRAISRKD
ncbi:MAG: hypothetical protein FWF41_04855 [Betaproteobacteria bacterium]|nr:hypothetical protein [Betaproteobacteria bacterium]